LGFRDKGRSVTINLFFCAFLISLLLPFSAAIPDASAFRVPEKLVYDLTWGGIKTGTATLEIREESGTRTIVSTARSAGWVSLFYTVDDRVESVLSKPGRQAALGNPRYCRIRIREGRYKRNKEIVFDGANRKALYVDHLNGEKKDILIRDDAYDPLSSFYYFRTIRAEPGKSVFVYVVDGKRLWNVEVRVLRKERITTKLGNFDTIVIKPLLKSEGLFSRRGDMYIWLTDDEKRIPVKLQTKVALGRVTATLTGGDY
jgi:hypothetical protein